jgi:AcrR family transcriptional regulator
MTARERLVETAERLFYAAGITSTGVDTVVREAGVSKPTLYAHFGSKEALVAAVLQARHARRAAQLEAHLEGSDDKLLAVFGFLGDWYGREGARGCGFLNAAAELPDAGSAARAAIGAEKQWLQSLLTTLARDAGCPEPERLGSQLLLLVDGISGRVVVHGPGAAPDAVADATAAAERLLA